VLPTNTPLEEGFGAGGGLEIELLEGEADAVGAAGLEFGAGEAVELGALALRQVGRVLKPQITAVLELGAALLFGPATPPRRPR